MSIVYSKEVRDEYFKLKIGSLEGTRPPPNLNELIQNPHLIYSGPEDNTCADILIECTLESDSKSLCPPMNTTYKYFTNQWNWNEWIEFPIAICDLARDTIVVIKIYDSIGPSKTVIVGKAFVSIFGHQGMMRTGLYDLRIWFENELDEAREFGDDFLIASLSGQDELDRLYELKSSYYSGQLAKIDWLDKLTFSEMEKMTSKMKADSKNMFLSVEFPKALIENTIDVPILYDETSLDIDMANSQRSSLRNGLTMIDDPELRLDNIIEGKHHKLSRSARSCMSDKDLKPNAAVRDQLNAIVSYPPTKVLTSEEQDLVWKFRYYLMSQKKALGKFLKCLNWQAPAEVSIALDLLKSWQPMDTQDALELLSPQFQHPQVRLYAVSRLRQATDEDLLLYLLQLVQALKYENSDRADTNLGDRAQGRQQQKNIELSQQISGLVLSPKGLQGQMSKAKPGENQLTDIETSKTETSQYQDKQQKKQVSSGGRGGSNVEVSSTLHLDEPSDRSASQSPEIQAASETSENWDLGTFLINRCVQDDVLANYFYWYLVVEIENFSQSIGDPGPTPATTSDLSAPGPAFPGSIGAESSSTFGTSPPASTFTTSITTATTVTETLHPPGPKSPTSTGAAAQNSLANLPLPNAANKASTSNQRNLVAYKIYTSIMNRFIRRLSSDDADFKRRRDFLARQRLFVDKLVLLMKMVAKENKNRLGKIERMKEFLGDIETLKFDFTHQEPPLSLPLDPSIKICGVIPERATLFKSQLMPCRLTLRMASTPTMSSSPMGHNMSELIAPDTNLQPGERAQGSDLVDVTAGGSAKPTTTTSTSTATTTQTIATSSLEYNVIFKHGDDLRQDQLILQTITLMDKLLRRENLDLRLTPYRVLATSTRHGFVQYIDSVSLAEVRASEGSIQNFFRRYAPSPDSPFGISPEVMDTYVRSCAGYCVITYLLGVGDRHLDNLLLTPTGKLFHIDFGYILGRDPKPMPPPPMKLTRDMVEAMGGTSSDLYREFLNLSHTAFLHLRRHSNLILNLFALMVDANVPDIALEPDKTVKKVQDKFRLDLSDEEAVHYIQNLIEISVSDVMAVLVEQIHKIAQYWRK